MNDLISRKAAIEALDGEIEITGRTNAEAVKGYVRLVRDRLERLPSAQPTPQWIPVSERLPSIPVWYLVTAKSKRNGNNFVRILHYNGEKYGWEEQSTCIVLAWAELPKPWKRRRR